MLLPLQYQLTLESADDDNGDLHRFLIASDPPQHLKSVHVGHNQIDNNQVGGHFLYLLHRFPAVRGNDHVISGKNDIVLQDCSLSRSSSTMRIFLRCSIAILSTVFIQYEVSPLILSTYPYSHFNAKM